MNTKTLIYSFAFLAFLTGVPFGAAYAQSRDSSATEAALAASDEEFLREMARDPESAIRRGEQVLSNTTLAPEPEPEKPKVKYIYKGEPIGQLRRAVVDDRVDDGYVQGLLQQRGPQ